MRLAPVQWGCGRAHSIEEIQFGGCWCPSLPVKWRNGQNEKLSCLFWNYPAYYFILLILLRPQKGPKLAQKLSTQFISQKPYYHSLKKLSSGGQLWCNSVMPCVIQTCKYRHRLQRYTHVCIKVYVCICMHVYVAHIEKKSLSKSLRLWTAPESLSGMCSVPWQWGRCKRGARGSHSQGQSSPG